MNFYKFLFILFFCHTLHAGSKDISIQTAKPDPNKVYPIAIIGAGAAGTMAMQRAVLNNIETLVFTGTKKEQKNSCGYWVKKVDNIPGLASYSRTVLELRNATLQEMHASDLGHNLFLIQDSICSIEKLDDHFRLTDGCGVNYFAQYVVLATGIMQEQPLIQSSIKPILAYANGQKVGYCCLCDGHRCYRKKVVVIGHGDLAANIALMLASKYELQSIAILANGRPLEMSQDNLIELSEQRIPIYPAPILKVLGNEEEKRLNGFELDSGVCVEAELCFVGLGIRPNNRLAVQLRANLSEFGLVITNEDSESSVPNLFVIGDLRAGSYKQIYTAWQHAVDAIQEIDNRLH